MSTLYICPVMSRGSTPGRQFSPNIYALNCRLYCERYPRRLLFDETSLSNVCIALRQFGFKEDKQNVVEQGDLELPWILVRCLTMDGFTFLGGSSGQILDSLRITKKESQKPWLSHLLVFIRRNRAGMTWSRDLKSNGKNCLLIFLYSPLIQSTTWRFQALVLTLHLAACVVVSTQVND